MTARELARILLAHPDLPVLIVGDDYTQHEITSAAVATERPSPELAPQPSAINILADWALEGR